MKVFNSKEWLKQKEKVKSKDESKYLNRQVQAGTFDAVKNCQYTLEDFTVVKLDGSKMINSSKNTIYYPGKSKFKSKPKNFDKTIIHVVEGDCLECGIFFKKNFKTNPVVLNMASDKTPGGGYRGGSGAQEENLHRRTNLYMCLEDPDKINKDRKWGWPLEKVCGIYSPDVQVFRSSEEKGYKFLETPEELSILTVAAVRRPKTKTNFQTKEILIEKDDAELCKDKMRIMFNIAMEHGHTCLILSAFGCGAFCNPPKHIAQLFKEVLSEYKGVFEYIVFSIIEDHNSNKKHNELGNVAPFSKVFQTNVMIIEKDELIKAEDKEIKLEIDL